MGFYGQPIMLGKSRTTEHNLLSTDHASEGQNHVQETGIANEQEEDGRGKKAERGEQALKIQPMISFVPRTSFLDWTC